MDYWDQQTTMHMTMTVFLIYCHICPFIFHFPKLLLKENTKSVPVFMIQEDFALANNFLLRAKILIIVGTSGGKVQLNK